MSMTKDEAISLLQDYGTALIVNREKPISDYERRMTEKILKAMVPECELTYADIDRCLDL